VTSHFASPIQITFVNKIESSNLLFLPSVYNTLIQNLNYFTNLKLEGKQHSAVLNAT
jgi:hypothetical protein